jgi:type IV pilus assembly protein PilX
MANKRLKNQTGATLIVALVMLLVLTLLAIAAIESSVVEERMAGNTLDRNVTFQAAESALRAGEAIVAAFPERPIPANGANPNGVSVLGSLDANPRWWSAKNEAWWTNNANAREYQPGGADFPGTNENPRIVIEEYDDVCDSASNPTLSQCKIVYRVTAIAWGRRNGTVLLQSLFARRY